MRRAERPQPFRPPPGRPPAHAALRAERSRSLASLLKVGFNSMPSQSRPRRSATTAVVPVPMKGSRTTPGRARREAIATLKLADLTEVLHPFAHPAALDPRRPRPRAVALHADPLRAGGEDRPLDEACWERGLVAEPVSRRRDCPDIAGVLAARVADPTGSLQLAEAVVAALIQARKLPGRSARPPDRTVRDADAVEVEEVAALLGGEDHRLRRPG